MRSIRPLALLVLLAVVGAAGYGYYAEISDAVLSLVAKSDSAGSASGVVKQSRPAGTPRTANSSGTGMLSAPRSVLVVPVRQDIFFDRVEAIGTLAANEAIVVTAKVQGIIEDINFEDGQSVEVGDVIVRFDDAEQRARLAVEQANLDEQGKQLERIAGLARTSAASQARLDEQVAAVEKARANVAAQTARVHDYTITAPFAGRLGTRRVSVGALVSPGTEITTLDDLTTVKLDFSIPETFLSTLREGQEIEAVSAAYPDHLFRGGVTAINSRVDPTTRSIEIRAKIPNYDGRLRPGMLLIVDLIKDSRDSLVVPEEALVALNNQQFVFVVDNNSRSSRIQVTIGRRLPGFVEVLEGLTLGDLVITEGHTNLRSGGTVRILNSEIIGRARPPSVSGPPREG